MSPFIEFLGQLGILLFLVLFFHYTLDRPYRPKRKTKVKP